MLWNGIPRQVGPFKTVTGEWAEDAPAVLEEILAAHFPDARVEAPLSSTVPKARGCDWATAKKIVSLERLRWAISTFEPYKALGSDGIHPVLLRKGIRMLALPLCKLLRACLAAGYVPDCWQEARVVFIPKAERALLGSVEEFRPISLAFFILKLLERLTDRYLWEVSFVENPLCKEQHANREGKSAETSGSGYRDRKKFKKWICPHCPV